MPLAGPVDPPSSPGWAPGWALVTGGSSGIGFALVEGLLSRGCRVVMIARDAVRLEAARGQALARLSATGPDSLETLALDVTDTAAVSAAMEGLVARLGPPAWVVTSAGMARPGRFLDQKLADHTAQWLVNYAGTLHILHGLAPAMAGAGRGKIILISSAAALGAFYGYSTYAPSKWAVRGLGQVLALELGVHGVQVTTAFPPDTDTPQLAQERLLRPPFTARFAAANPVLSPAFVAQAILSAADRGQREVAPGRGANLLLRLGPPFARYLAWLQRRLLRRHTEEAAPPPPTRGPA